jgi:DNA-binding GntR family transcriptional regulator
MAGRQQRKPTAQKARAAPRVARAKPRPELALVGARGGSSKTDQIYATLKQGIVSGELPPGSPLDKLTLCAQFGVSRLTISLAVDRLAFDGLVVIEPQRGSYVSRIRLGDVKQWMLIRRALECEIAGQCADAFDTALIANVSRNLAYQRAALDHGDLDRFHEFDVTFHALLVEGLALPRVAEVLDQLRTHVGRVRRMLLRPPGRPKQTLREHEAIFSAIQRHKPAAAAKAMGAHLDHVLRELEAFEAEHPTFFA